MGAHQKRRGKLLQATALSERDHRVLPSISAILRPLFVTAGKGFTAVVSRFRPTVPQNRPSRLFQNPPCSRTCQRDKRPDSPVLG